MTAGGQVIRFAEDEVRPMGLPAGGIAGIKLHADDLVIGGAVLGAETGKREVALLTSAGFGRRSPLTDFPAKGRGTQGVGAKLAAKSGPVVSSLLVKPTDKLLVAVSQGEPKPLAVKAIPHAARTAAGKVVLVLRADQALGAVMLPEAVVAPEAPKTNGSTPAEKPKRSSKKSAEAQAVPVAAPQTKAATNKAEPGAPRTRASAAKAEKADAKAKAASTSEAPASKPEAAAKPEASAAKTKAAAKPEATAAKTKAAAGKAEPTPAMATGQTTAAKPARTKKAAAAPATVAPAAPPAKDAGSAAAPTTTRGKKPAELPRAPGPTEDVVSHRGRPGVLARPTVTDSGQMLLVPPDPPSVEPPAKKPRKGTTK